MVKHDVSAELLMASNRIFNPQSLNFWHKWMLLFVDLLMPFAFTSAVFNTLNAAALARLGVGISITVIGTGIFSRREGTSKGGLLVGLLVAGLYSYLTGMWRDSTQFVAFILLTLAVLFRSIRFLGAALVNDAVRLALKVDSVLTVCAFIAYAGFGHPQLTPYLEPYILGAASVTAIAVRMALLWRLERLEAGIHRARGRVLLWIPLIAVLMFLALPSLSRFLIYALIILDYVVTVPLVYLLSGLHWKLPALHKPHLLQRLSAVHPHHEVTTHAASGVGLRSIALSLFIAIIVGYLFWTLRKRRGTTVRSVVNAPRVERRRIHRRNSLNFLSATNPVRLAYQAFIREQSRRGDEMHNVDTVRTYERRLSDRLQDEERQRLTQLSEAYERVRYGASSDPQSSPEEP